MLLCKAMIFFIGIFLNRCTCWHSSYHTFHLLFFYNIQNFVFVEASCPTSSCTCWIEEFYCIFVNSYILSQWFSDMVAFTDIIVVVMTAVGWCFQTHLKCLSAKCFLMFEVKYFDWISSKLQKNYFFVSITRIIQVNKNLNMQLRNVAPCLLIDLSVDVHYPTRFDMVYIYILVLWFS